MNIAFLSSLNPNDQNNWSGTLYSLYTSLQKKHRVIWVGETVFAEVWEFHKANFKNNETFFFQLPYSPSKVGFIWTHPISFIVISSKFILTF